jgi:hypothetical protein
MQLARPETRKKKFARIIFCIGVVLSLLGGVFILLNFASLSRRQIAGSFLLLIIGGLCVFFAIKLKRRPLYLFFAALFILVILFLLFRITGVIKLTLKQSWPILSVFSGLALLPAGRRRYGDIRRIYLVPSIAMVALGGFLMLFSLRITSFSFKQFALEWGPVIIVISGIMLLLLLLGGGRERT